MPFDHVHLLLTILGHLVTVELTCLSREFKAEMKIGCSLHLLLPDTRLSQERTISATVDRYSLINL